MPIDALLPALVGGVQMAGSFYDTNQQIKGQEAANKMNVELSREQMRWNEMMWHKQNAYNNPLAQMDRLKAAGLNPHLIYGTSPSSAVGNAGSVQGYNKADVKNTMAGYDAFSKAGQALQNTVHTSNVMANTEVARQEAVAKSYQTLNSAIDYDKKAFDLGLSKELRQTSVDAAQANARQVIANADRSRTDAETARLLQNPVVQKARIEMQKAMETLEGEKLNNALKKIELELSRDLKPYGITPSDNVFLRLWMSFINDPGSIIPF